MIGQLVGHYKVVRKIGDGGMGSVFEAKHEAIGRRVAIKVLKPQFSKDKNVVTRFFNEARAVNIVSHPGVVGSFDYGELPDGTAYIVMEYLEGETLSSRIKRKTEPMGFDALRIGRQIGAALAAAHTKGIIHRDATQKPAFCLWASVREPKAQKCAQNRGMVIATPRHTSCCHRRSLKRGKGVQREEMGARDMVHVASARNVFA